MTEWISFEDAGRLVDGPAGWTRSEDGSRLHAQALFAMAKKGLVAVTATNWLCRYNGDDETIATDRDKPELLLALEAREKLGSDVFTALLAPAMKRVYIFSLFDEASGNYQVTGVTKISYDSGDQDRYPSGHFVNGLRFNRADVVNAFVSSRPATNTKRGNVSPNRKMDHGAVIAMAQQWLQDDPTLKIGPAAASISATIAPNPKTGNPFNQRGIERIIAHLWRGENTGC